MAPERAESVLEELRAMADPDRRSGMSPFGIRTDAALGLAGELARRPDPASRRVGREADRELAAKAPLIKSKTAPARS
jgi:hypothetical protein